MYLFSVVIFLVCAGPIISEVYRRNRNQALSLSIIDLIVFACVYMIAVPVLVLTFFLGDVMPAMGFLFPDPGVPITLDALMFWGIPLAVTLAVIKFVAFPTVRDISLAIRSKRTEASKQPNP